MLSSVLAISKRFFYLFIIVSFILITSCEEQSTEPKEVSLSDRLMGKYDGTVEIYYIDLVNGQTYEGRKTPTVIEITEVNGNGNQWNFYIDGYWQLTLNTQKEYDGIMYFNVLTNTGRFSDNGASFTLQGFPNEGKYHSSFNSKTGRFYISYEYINIEPSPGHDTIILYEGYHRE